MSEYQYYEFLAIDRPLSEREMRTLRSFSTRATITPTSFVNEYNWGDFRGDEDAWMDKYFDAFLYLANWGTRVFKLRLPSRTLPLGTAEQFCAGDSFSVREKDSNVIVAFVSDQEPEDGWEEGDGWLASIVGVRAEIARGDLRALYLGWLMSVQNEEVDADTPEPPVPDGLNELSASLGCLARFMRIDDDLMAAAAETSGPLASTTEDGEAISRWVANLDSREKDEVLVDLMKGEGACAGNELLARFRREQPAPAVGVFPAKPGRTVDDFLRGAEKRRRIAAEKAAKALDRRQRKAQAEREEFLDGLAGREPELWTKIEQLVSVTQPKSYDEAVAILLYLRDLAARNGDAGFRQRIDALCFAHARKPSLLARLKKSGLLK